MGEGGEGIRGEHRLNAERSPTVALTISGGAGCEDLAWRFPIPVGHALSVLRATPRQPGAFELQARDVAQQFRDYCEAHDYDRDDCKAVTIEVSRAEHFDLAAALGRPLHVRSVRVVLRDGVGDLPDSVQLNAIFVKRLS